MPQTKSQFSVLNGGLYTTVQDLGRSGVSAQGLSQGGALDRFSFELCNKLLDNDINSACLEVTYGGLTIKAEGQTCICLTGAEAELKVNGQTKPTWQSIWIDAGDVVEIALVQNGSSPSGIRSYLGVTGGIQTEKVFNSRSTVVRERLGSNNGKPLKAGDRIPYFAINNRHEVQFKRLNNPPTFDHDIELRVVTGYQADWFDAVALRRFFSSEYIISNQNDRMGYRLQGSAIHCSETNMYSEGIALGAIQIPADGQPIILLNDRQTLGGYPKIGSVFQPDLGLLAQCGTGGKIRFRQITIEDAHNQLMLYKRYQQKRLNQDIEVINHQ